MLKKIFISFLFLFYVNGFACQLVNNKNLVQTTNINSYILNAYKKNESGNIGVIGCLAAGPNLFQYQFSDDYFYDNSDIQVITKNYYFLPYPIFIVLGIAPGGSDSLFRIILIGAKNKNFYNLNKNILFETNIEGGIYIGYLGKQYGDGVAVWNFEKGDGTSHADPHHYSLKLYKWDGTQFNIEAQFTSKNAYNTSAEALKELGFHFDNQLRLFSKVKEYS